MANNSFNLCVSSFVSFSINGLKENAENLNYYPILRRKVVVWWYSIKSWAINTSMWSMLQAGQVKSEWNRMRGMFGVVSHELYLHVFPVL